MKVEDLNIEGACWSWIKIIDILNKSLYVEMLHIFYNVTSKIEKYQSNNLEIEKEVPQGSILGLSFCIIKY